MAARNENVGLNKQKGVGATSKNGQGMRRPALADIGNLVPINGKPVNRPITRGYSKLLVDAQAALAVPVTKKSSRVEVKAADKRVIYQPVINNAAKLKGKQKEVVPERVNLRPATRKVNHPPKEGDDYDKTNFTRSDSYRSVSSRRRMLHTLTYMLSVRSKGACGISQAEDIDEGDLSDQFDVAEYVEDIYIYYKQVESTYWPRDYTRYQTEIKPERRETLIGWIIKINHHFKLRPETLYLSIYIFDRYLSLERKLVPEKEIQLLGLTAVVIASKYEEVWSPSALDLIHVTGNVYKHDDVLKKEKNVLNKLGWYLTVPTTYMFLVRFVNVGAHDDNEIMEHMIHFYAELALTNYSFIEHVPSFVAASSVYAARCTLNKTPLWTHFLAHRTDYSEPEISESARKLLILHMEASRRKSNAVYNKYSEDKFQNVALYLPAIYMATTSHFSTGTSTDRL